MTYEIGDQVVLPAHGVGHIVGLAERQFQGQDPGWYYEVSTQKSTIWVAVNSLADSGLRPVATKAEVTACARILRGEPDTLERDHFRRRNILAQRLRSGTLTVLCEVVRDLSALGARRPLAEADASMLRRAREHLSEEWATARGVTLAEAAQEIDALLQARRPAAAPRK
jgi:CarD family transcriptional regulator